MKLDLNYTNNAWTGGTRYFWHDGLPALASVDAEYAPYNDRFTERIDRLGWLGKERDLESGLGDHGVRKYDAGSGRFLSVDPLWEKYLGWTPYQYSANNPVNAVDVDGRDIIVLIDRQGANQLGFAAGHAAMLIGNDNEGWALISKNGTDGFLRAFGESERPQLGKETSIEDQQRVGESYYATFNDFLNDQNSYQTRYDEGFRISSNKETDKRMLEAGKQATKSRYNVFNANCMDAVNRALEAGGFKTKRRIEKTGRKYGELIEDSYQHQLPNDQYDLIKSNNSGTTIDLSW